jgi:hypothetical protein
MFASRLQEKMHLLGIWVSGQTQGQTDDRLFSIDVLKWNDANDLKLIGVIGPDQF